MAKLSTEKFIQKAKAVHGDRYDYSNVEYVNNQTKVCIVCKEHGEFWQVPYTHLNGHGCPKCAYKGVRKRHIYSQKEIIEKIQSLFGERYSFEKVVYKAMKVPIILVCHEKDENGVEHGDFSMRPVNIFSSHQECPKCSKQSRIRLQRKPVEKFIEEAKIVHGDLYEYHKVDYINTNSKVCIVCKIHGDFWQTPSNHLNGKGCPCCSGNFKKWNKETCEQEAHKYEFFFDFRTKSPGACNVAKRNGWLNDYKWLNKLPSRPNDYDKNTKYIYAYEFVKQNAVYVGLTNSMIKRDWQHRTIQKSSVNKFAFNNHIEIPIPKKLEEAVPIHESGKRENYWVNYYKEQGWSVLNRAKTGERESSIGIYYPIKWNKKAIKEKAKECDYNLKLFAAQYPGAYAAIQSRYKGLLNELFPDRMIHTHHTVEDALLVVRNGNYKNRSNLRFDCIWAYRILFDNNLLDEVFGKPKEYTKEEALIEADDYKSIEQIRTKNHALWNYLRINNLFKEAKPTDGMFRRVKSVEEAWELSMYYENMTELSNHAKVAYRLLKENGLLEKRYPDSIKFIDRNKDYSFYNFERCKQVYEKCAFVADVKKRHSKVYKIAKEQGWHGELKTCCYGSTHKWTKTACETIVSKYTYLKDLLHNEPNVYNVIKRYNWDDLLKHLKKVRNAPSHYTIEEIKEICAPYNNLLELSKARKDIENYCRRKGIDLYELNGWKNLRNRKVCKTLDGMEIATFSSVSEAARSMDVPKNRMWEHVQSEKPYKGFVWRFKDD